MGMDRYDYVGVGAFLSEDQVRPTLNTLSTNGWDELMNYDISAGVPGLIYGEGMDGYVAMVPFVEPADRDGWVGQGISVNDLHVSCLKSNVKAWCLEKFGVEVEPKPMVFSRWW